MNLFDDVRIDAKSWWRCPHHRRSFTSPHLRRNQARRGKRACAASIMCPIYLVHYNIWETSLKTKGEHWGLPFCLYLQKSTKSICPFEMDKGQATNHSGQQDQGFLCVCVRVCPWHLTPLLAHSTEPCRTNCPAWLSLRSSAARRERDMPETQRTGL